jgi:hypothetical protein
MGEHVCNKTLYNISHTTKKQVLYLLHLNISPIDLIIRNEPIIYNVAQKLLMVKY